MKTSPYVAFYPSDFLVGTMCMSAEEVGAYMRLLCFQWQQGGIPQQGDKLARITGLPARKLDLVLTKFTLHEDGLLKNSRMEIERVKVESFRDRQSENGRKGGRPKKSQEGPAQTHARIPENPRVISGFSHAEPAKSQSEAETESKSETESSFPPHPPGGRESESEGKAEEIQVFPPPESRADASCGLTESMVSLSGPAFSTRPKIQTAAWDPAAEQIQIGAWFNRKPTTVWSDKEQKAWKTLHIEDEDLEILQWFYTESGCRYLRQDLGTLLNNWRGEVDRARNFIPEDTRVSAR